MAHGVRKAVQPDDIAREICRHCATVELRKGNTLLLLTSPCYITPFVRLLSFSSPTIISTLFFFFFSFFSGFVVVVQLNHPPCCITSFVLTDRQLVDWLGNLSLSSFLKALHTLWIWQNSVITSILIKTESEYPRRNKDEYDERKGKSKLFETPRRYKFSHALNFLTLGYHNEENETPIPVMIHVFNNLISITIHFNGYRLNVIIFFLAIQWRILSVESIFQHIYTEKLKNRRLTKWIFLFNAKCINQMLENFFSSTIAWYTIFSSFTSLPPLRIDCEWTKIHQGAAGSQVPREQRKNYILPDVVKYQGFDVEHPYMPGKIGKSNFLSREKKSNHSFLFLHVIEIKEKGIGVNSWSIRESRISWL